MWISAHRLESSRTSEVLEASWKVCLKVSPNAEARTVSTADSKFLSISLVSYIPTPYRRSLTIL